MKKTVSIFAFGMIAFSGCSKAFELDAQFGLIKVDPSEGLATTESGGKASFSVSLEKTPTSQVSVSLRSSDITRGTIDKSRLIFSPENWASAQVVTITGIDDGSVADGSHIYKITFDAAESDDANYKGLKTPDLNILHRDNESGGGLPGVSISTISGSLHESGGIATFTVYLNALPTANTEVVFTSSLPGKGQLIQSGGGCTTGGGTSPAATCKLTFTPANWNAPQTVTVQGVDNNLADGAFAFSIVTSTIAVGGAEYVGINPIDIPVNSVDNGVAGFVVGAISGNTTEAGGTATFKLRLANQPAANVTVAITSSNTNEGSVSPTSITFTSANWNTDRTVTVTGVADNRIDVNQEFEIRATASGAGTYYNTMSITPVSVTNENVDAGKYIFISSSLMSGSGGAGADSVCNNDVNRPRLGSTYKAIIGKEAADDATVLREAGVDWVLAANQKYYRPVDNRLIGTTDALARLPFNLTNSFHTSAMNFWSGLAANFMHSGFNCKASGQVSWSRIVPGTGGVGSATAIDGNAISSGTASCNSPQRLLCAEQ